MKPQLQFSTNKFAQQCVRRECESFTFYGKFDTNWGIELP